MEELYRECLAFRLASAWRRVDRLLNRGFRRIGLTHAQGHLLACLLAHGDQRIIDLANRTGFDPSTVGQLTAELARHRLIRRRRHPEDRRARLLGPARRGEALRGKIEDVLRRAEARLRRDLPDADREGLLRATTVIDRLP